MGTGKETSIRELAETIQEVVGFQGSLVFDATRPDGTQQKILDISKIKSLGWQSSIPLKEGLEQVYKWYSTYKISS